ncbi:transporter [Fodinibius saliphilus]|uniref:transporter n=1 Tax=Fodinibius saliphilus TaxID=1920650 RepID=UPI0011098E5E|nr:transporter [Fodinibius saliphilus]
MSLYRILRKSIATTGFYLLLIGMSNALYAQHKIYYSGSIQLAEGNYFFEKSTWSLYATNSITISALKFRVSVDIPMVFQSSPWVSYNNVGGIPTGGPQNSSVRGYARGGRHGNGKTKRRAILVLSDTASYSKFGISDPSVFGEYSLVQSESGATALNINFSVKFPFADPDKGFGTGAWDLGIGGSMVKRFGTWFISGNVMYWNLGDMDELVLENTWYFGASLGKEMLNGKWTIMGSVGSMSEVIEGIDPPITVGLGINYILSEQITLLVNAFKGFSEGASDLSFGGGCQIRLN